MNSTRFVAWSALVAVVMAGLLIAVSGYYYSIFALPAQIVSVVVPSLAPFFVLSAMPDRRLLPSIACWTIVAVSWAYVGYVDSRPYQGGGASLAGIFGWMGCGAAMIVAALAVRRSGHQN